jgi:hypothetical protein
MSSKDAKNKHRSAGPAKTIKISARAYNNILYALQEIGGNPPMTIQRLVDICLDYSIQHVVKKEKKPQLTFEQEFKPDAGLDIAFVSSSAGSTSDESKAVKRRTSRERRS